MEGNLIQRHPAETLSPVASSLAVLIAWALDADPEIIAPLAIVFAFVPAAITWVVELRKSRAT
jgi:hypothetical protein